MPAPIPIWWDPNPPSPQNPGPTTTWSVGTVDADSTSAEKEFWIFNNKGGSEAVSDMTNVFITTKDTNGLDGGPVANVADSANNQAYVQVSIFDGSIWSAFETIGGSSNVKDVLNAAGWIDAENGDTKANRLSGMVNPTDPTDVNYDDANTKKKMAKVRLRLVVKEGAAAGPMAWKTRCSYQYT